MVLDRFHFRLMWYLFVWGGVIPIVLEIMVMFLELANCLFKSRYRVKPGTRSQISIEKRDQKLFEKYLERREERKKHMHDAKYSRNIS